MIWLPFKSLFMISLLLYDGTLGYVFSVPSYKQKLHLTKIVRREYGYGNSFQIASKHHFRRSKVKGEWILQGHISTNIYDSFQSIDFQMLQHEQKLELFWIVAFALSHIGMSAIREKLIHVFGIFATNANWIDRGLTLPSYWPGDDIGKNKIFPDENTAGRQIYRIFYTIVSFITLGSAFAIYLSILNGNRYSNEMIQQQYKLNQNLYLSIASTSFAASIASLFNASPLGLMPSFQENENTSTNSIMIERNDSLKLSPKGLTRITRHPLILPVVPWGISTSFLAGGKVEDFILFGGLAIYAIAGCACQDLRVVRKEGSVGTVFSSIEKNTIVDSSLMTFYLNTSFIPFGAILDGRQSMKKSMIEFPILPFLVGLPIGLWIEKTILIFLQ